MAGCLSDDDAAACASGAATEAEIAAWDEHTDGCVACRQLVSLLVAAQRTSTAETPRFFVGRQVGRFELRAPLGVGGMGCVFEAHDPQLARAVAIKLVRLSPHEPHARERLLRESRAQAQLSHPNVVTIYEAGVEGEEVYVAMELVSGTTLAAWTTVPRGWREVLARYLEAARGLAAIHAAQLVHRDIKPENLLLGDDGRVRVGDFGIAHAASPEAAPLDAIAGTPRYMAPEVRVGEPATAASDQWSLAAAAWIALGGTLDEGRAIGVPRGPRWLRAVLARALRTEPDARHASVDAMIAAIERRRRRTGRIVVAITGAGGLAIGLAVATLHARGATVDPCATATSALADAWTPAARAGVLAKLGSAAPSVRFAEDIARLVDARVAAWTAARTETCRGDSRADTDAVVARAACLDRQLVILRGTIGALEAERAPLPRLLELVEDAPRADECASAELALVRGRLPADPARRGILSAAIARLASARQRWKLAADPAVAEIAADVARTATDAPGLRARALLQVAQTEAARTDPRAVDTLHEALTAAAEARDELAQAEIQLALLDVSRFAPTSERDAAWLDRELGARLAALAAIAPETAERLDFYLLLGRGTLASLRSDPASIAAAVTALTAASTRAEHFFGAGWRTVRVRGSLAYSLVRAGRFVEGDRTITETLPVVEAYLGPHHPELAAQLQLAAGAAHFAGDEVRARTLAGRALAITAKTGVIGHRVAIHEILADIDLAEGKLAAALAHLDQILADAATTTAHMTDLTRVRARRACALRAQATGTTSESAALASASCFLAGNRPAASVAIIEAHLGRAGERPGQHEPELRFTLARSLADRRHPDDLERAIAEARRASRACARARCALAPDIERWLHDATTP